MQEPLRSEQKEAILRSAGTVLDEAIAFLQGMIRIPTVNPPGEGYPACARYIGEQLHRLGYSVEYINLTPAELAELPLMEPACHAPMSSDVYPALTHRRSCILMDIWMSYPLDPAGQPIPLAVKYA